MYNAFRETDYKRIGLEHRLRTAILGEVRTALQKADVIAKSKFEISRELYASYLKTKFAKGGALWLLACHATRFFQ